MGVTEKDHGGVVQGISEVRGTRARSTRSIRPLEHAAEEEQAPGKPLPDRTVKATPEQFGKFAQQKRR